MTTASPSGESTLPATIVPRWEWRTFGERFGDAEAQLRILPPGRVQESDEIYLLSLETDASVKVRDGLMDVKTLQHVDEDGLEQWLPVLKGTFPLAASDARLLLRALGVDESLVVKDEYSLEELISAVLAPTGSVRAVRVHKHREHFTPGGAMAELSTLASGVHVTRSIAVESEDPALVIDAVRKLGLSSCPNVCVARGLKTLVSFETIRYAAIDVGTNSVKFHIGEHRPDGTWRTIADRAEVTRLGEGMYEGALHATAVDRTVDAIASMVSEARREATATIAAVGTAGLRSAVNGAELVDAVRARCGVGIEIISGEEEARLAYVGATAELAVGDGTLAVFDT